MTQFQLVEVLITNGFEVKQTEGLDVYYQNDYLLTLEGTEVIKIGNAVNEIPDYKYGQLLHIVKKYQDLIYRESVVTF